MANVEREKKNAAKEIERARQAVRDIQAAGRKPSQTDLKRIRDAEATLRALQGK